MNYEQKYKEALERARKELQEFTHKDCDDTTRRIAINIVYNLFPELKESEDERIREGLIKAFRTIGKKDWGGLIVRDIIAWLEKQDKKLNAELGQSEVTKTSDQELESKFHPGDWIVDDKTPNDVFLCD